LVLDILLLSLMGFSDVLGFI